MRSISWKIRYSGLIPKILEDFLSIPGKQEPMDLKSIWIGETLRVISRNAVVRFEGISKGGEALVKDHTGIWKALAEDLELWVEPEPEPIPDPDEPLIKPGFSKLKSAARIFDGVIDLHFEKLAPERISNPPPHILEFQLLKCKEFIEEGVQKKVSYLRIIHGKGEGKLKSAVEHLLTFYPQTHSFYSTPDLGALEVRLQHQF